MTYQEQFLRKAFHPSFVGPAPPPVTQTLLASDTFNRTNNPSSLGSTNGTGSLDPRTWTAQNGVWGITLNEAYTSALGAGPTASIATIDVATANVDVAVTMAVDGGVVVNGQGLVLRYVDNSNYIRMIGDNTQCVLVKIVAGSPVSILTTFGTLSPGTVMRVTASGDTFNVYLDGVLKGTATESTFNAATKVGLYCGGTAQRFDEFSVYTA